jgi:hypothetical protein
VPGCVQRLGDRGQGGVLPGHADDELVGLIADGLEAGIGSRGLSVVRFVVRFVVLFVVQTVVHLSRLRPAP